MKKKLIKCSIWSVAVYGSEKWTLGKKKNSQMHLKQGAGEECKIKMDR